MNVQLPAICDKSAFLAWVQGCEGRYELVEARVIMMVRRLASSRLIVESARSVEPCTGSAALDGNCGSSASMPARRPLRYPDIMVDGPDGAGADYTATAPALLAEVLFPSSARRSARQGPSI